MSTPPWLAYQQSSQKDTSTQKPWEAYAAEEQTAAQRPSKRHFYTEAPEEQTAAQYAAAHADQLKAAQDQPTYFEQHPETRMQQIKSAGSGLASGAEALGHFAEDVFNPTVPVMKGPNSLYNRYIRQPYQDAAASATQEYGSGHPILGALASIPGAKAAYNAWEENPTKALGNFVGQAGGAKTAGAVAGALPEAAERIGNIATDVGAAKDAEALQANAKARLNAAATEARNTLQRGYENQNAEISKKYDTIRAKDEANPAPKGTGHTASEVVNGVEQRLAEVGQGVAAPNASVNKLVQDLHDLGNAQLTFTDMQNLRTRIGSLLYERDLPNTVRTGLKAGRDQLTDFMRERAIQLGEQKRFETANNEYGTLQNFKEANEHLLDDTGHEANVKLFNTLAGDDPHVRQALSNLGPHGDQLRQIASETGPIRKALAPQNANIFGSLRSIGSHPIPGMLGYVGGGMLGKMFGSEWIGRLLGASEGAKLGNRLELAKNLRTGNSYPAAVSELEQTGAGTYQPRMVKNADIKSGTVQNPPARPSNPEPTAPKTPRYAYRGMPVNEQGITGARYDQASSSPEEAASYAATREAQTGQPHRVVRINLNNLPPDSYEVSGGVNMPDLYRFKGNVPEEHLESQPDLHRPKTITGQSPEMEKNGIAKSLNKGSNYAQLNEADKADVDHVYDNIYKAKKPPSMTKKTQ